MFAQTSSSPIQPTVATNADAAELAKFSQIAHRWWDKEAEFKPLHAINPLRLQWIIEQAGGIKGKRVVDIGCGGGILSDSMARAGASVLGIDLSTKALKVAQLHALEAETQDVQYREMSAEALAAEQPTGFDLVTCMEMLEHVPEPASVVAACATLVKPGGTVVFSSINRNVRSWLTAIVGAEYLLGIVPRGTHEFAKLVTPAELSSACRSSGLIVRGSTGLHHNPITGRFWLASDSRVNYMLAAVKV